MKEIWKSIKGFDGYYQASNLGRVRSLTRAIRNCHGGISIRKGTIMRPRKTGRGYVAIAIHKLGRRHQLNVGRLVAGLFIPNPDNLPEINHKNGIKADNRDSNLEWSNRSLNMIHAWEMGLRQ